MFVNRITESAHNSYQAISKVEPKEERDNLLGEWKEMILNRKSSAKELLIGIVLTKDNDGEYLYDDDTTIWALGQIKEHLDNKPESFLGTIHKDEAVFAALKRQRDNEKKSDDAFNPHLDSACEEIANIDGGKYGLAINAYSTKPYEDFLANWKDMTAEEALKNAKKTFDQIPPGKCN